MPTFSFLLVRDSPESTDLRDAVSRKATALGVTLRADFRYPCVEVADARTLSAVARLLRTSRYRFEVVPGAVVDLVLDWRRVASALAPALARPGLMRVTPSVQQELSRLLARTRADEVARVMLLGARGRAPDLAALDVIPAVHKTPDGPVSTCVALAVALGTPLERRTAALARASQSEPPSARELRVSLVGATLPEAVDCARRCIAAFRDDEPLALAVHLLTWAAWAEGLPAKAQREVGEALAARFIAAFEGRGSKPFRLTAAQRRRWVDEDGLPMRLPASWLEAWCDALLGSADEGALLLRSHVAAALKKAHPAAARRVARTPC